MKVRHNISLKAYNTFGIDATASRLVEVEDIQSLQEVLRTESDTSPLLLGGGSNILFTKDPDDLVIVNKIRGKEILLDEDHHVLIKVGAGENWHDLVLWTLQNGIYGLENLSLIPGTVGAAPMQNIGAYGVEIREVFHELEAVELATGEVRVFNGEECQFGYRESVFKKALKGKYFIASVTLALSKKANVNIAYGAIREVLRERGIENPTPQEVSELVIHIRQSKLPDPDEIGNAGSFFKNPVISLAKFRELKEKWTALPGYSDGDEIKVPAAWLIEQSGWKGKRVGEVGVHEKQALVLVNYGDGRGEDLLQLSQEIQGSVKQTFDIDLVPEVNIL